MGGIEHDCALREVSTLIPAAFAGRFDTLAGTLRDEGGDIGIGAEDCHLAVLMTKHPAADFLLESCEALRRPAVVPQGGIGIKGDSVAVHAHVLYPHGR